MTYEIYRYIFMGGLIACGIFLAISVILFFTLRIPKVISDLSGRTARKAIENIRMQNEQSGDKSYQSSAVNLERGKLTDKISRSGRLMKGNSGAFGTGMITEKISTQKLSAEESAETSVLAAVDESSVPEAVPCETTVLEAAPCETTVLEAAPCETTVLNAGAGETTVLDGGYGEPGIPVAEFAQQEFVVEYEITFTHTNEVITQGVAL